MHHIVKTPGCDKTLTSAWAQYTLTIDNRDKVQKALKSKNIPSIIYYPIPLSKQDGYLQYPSVTSGLNISNKLANRVLSLPMHPYLKEGEISRISEEVCSILMS